MNTPPMRQIKLSYDPKPIPDRRFDWSATFDDYDGAPDSPTRGHIGYGGTASAALTDLITNYWEG